MNFKKLLNDHVYQSELAYGDCPRGDLVELVEFVGNSLVKPESKGLFEEAMHRFTERDYMVHERDSHHRNNIAFMVALATQEEHLTPTEDHDSKIGLIVSVLEFMMSEDHAMNTDFHNILSTSDWYTDKHATVFMASI